MWEEDTAGHMTDNATDQANACWKSRRLRVFNKQCELAGRLHMDVTLQEKYLPNAIKMRFHRNMISSAFHLFGSTADQERKLQIDEAVLNIRTVQLLPVVANDLNRQIATHNMKIPIHHFNRALIQN